MLLFIMVLLAALGSGLMSGLFFAFSTFIMQAFAKRPAPVGISAMQSIDETILNPIFFTVFFGTAVLGLVLAVMALLSWSAAGSAWLLTGGVVYFVGSIVVTMLFNVPLNNQLAKVEPESAEGAAFWQHYLSVWTRWNHVRTVACLGATVCFILGLR